MMRNYPEAALHVPRLLLPGPGVALESWSVIACDQYTSQPEYWEETRRLVGNRHSTLDLVLPEAHLALGERESAIRAINRHMAEYLADGVLVEHEPGFMLVERDVGRPSPRRGLVVALDLEHFDFRDGAEELVRSTEETDPARLPARMAVRRHAPLETPHILVLIDDPQRTVIEPLADLGQATAYDFELMQGGGRVHGKWVNDAKAIEATASRLAGLRRGEPPMLYAMGDGNHSLAAARAVWAEIKAEEAARSDHPARYALVELVNVHDEGLTFAPIHRLTAGIDSTVLLEAMAAHFQGVGFSHRTFANREQWRQACADADAPGQRIPYLTATGFGLAHIHRPDFRLESASLHGFLDPFLTRHDGAGVDYIHGGDVLEELAKAERRVGFFLPAMDKHDLFKTVVEEGATPRKTFSLGEADEKRFYLECRRLRP